MIKKTINSKTPSIVSY